MISRFTVSVFFPRKEIFKWSASACSACVVNYT